MTAPRDHRTYVGLTGYAQHGKDTVGAVLVQEFGFVRFAFADTLKKMALVLDPIVRPGTDRGRLSQIVADDGWDGAKKLPEVRRFLQVLGTEGVRDHLGENSWVDGLAKAVRKTTPEDASIVITDVRFPNEEEFIHAVGGEVWRIERYEDVERFGDREWGPNPDTGELFYATQRLYDNGLGTDHPSERFVMELAADRVLRAVGIALLRDQARVEAIEMTSRRSR